MIIDVPRAACVTSEIVGSIAVIFTTAQLFGQPEIEYLHITSDIKSDVVRLYVSVYNSKLTEKPE